MGGTERHDPKMPIEHGMGGVLFGDGIEDDRVDFSFGITASVRVAGERLMLVR